MDVAPIEADGEWSVGAWEVGPVAETAINEARLFVSQLRFRAFSHGVQMIAHRGGIKVLPDRQYVRQQVSRHPVRYEGGPLRFQIEQFGRAALGEPLRQGTESLGWVQLALTVIETRAFEAELPEQRPDRDRVIALVVAFVPTVGTVTLRVQVLGRLLFHDL